MKTLISLAFIFVIPLSMPPASESFAQQKSAPKKSPAEPIYRLEDHWVICNDETNGVFWSVALEGRLEGVRPPHLVLSAEAVFVSQGDGVSALHAKTGKILWHSAGPNERMRLSKDLLLATRCGYSDVIKKEGRCMTARSATSGKEVFRVKLPPDFEDPDPIDERAGFIMIHDDRPAFQGKSLLIDRTGHIQMRWDRQIVDAVSQREDLIILTGEQITRVTLDKKIRWHLPLEGRASGRNGGILRLPEGDILAYQYHDIADSGVELTRLDADKGKRKWRTFCRELGVPHSAYLHEVKVTLEERPLKVTSRGSFGDFVELIDPQTGKQLQRKEYRGDKRLP
jgi:hypothetical protein